MDTFHVFSKDGGIPEDEAVEIQALDANDAAYVWCEHGDYNGWWTGGYPDQWFVTVVDRAGQRAEFLVTTDFQPTFYVYDTPAPSTPISDEFAEAIDRIDAAAPSPHPQAAGGEHG